MKITPRCWFAVLLVATLVIACGCPSDSQDSAVSGPQAGTDQPKRTPPKVEPPPNELSAAHILVMHKGSQRVPDDITRTKEEALALAKEIATKAKAEGADSPRWRQSIRTAPVAPRVATWAILGHVI